MGLVITVCSGKGGVGKSTISSGLAYAFSDTDKRVLIVDCDAGMRSIDKIMGIEEKVIFNIWDVIKGECAPVQAIYEVNKNLFVMPASNYSSDIISVNALNKLMSLLKKHFDYIVIDCPAGVSGNFKSAVYCADEIMVVCTPDPICVRSASYVKDLLEASECNKFRLIINRFNSTFFEKIDELSDLDSIIDNTGIQLVGVVPEDGILAADFLSGRKTTADAKAMQALTRIAKRLLGVSLPIII